MLIKSWKFVGLAGVASLALSLSASPVFAQSQPAQNSSGSTSGPAAGGNVEPSTAVQKQQGNKPGVASGAPGMAAKKGSESGAKPDKSPQQ